MTDEAYKRVELIKDESWGPVDGDKRWLIAALETEAKWNEQLTGCRFSQRMHAALVSRAEAAEKDLAEMTANAEIERLAKEAAEKDAAYQRRHRKWLIGEARESECAYHCVHDAWVISEKRWKRLEAERDKWMARFDEAEHRGLAYMEERNKLAQRG